MTVNELSQYAGGVEFEEVAKGTITNSKFTSLTGKGGAFKISSNAFFKQQNSDVSYTITNSEITNCQSSNHGGGIYVDTIKQLTLTNSFVTGNKALLGEGGGIYFKCYEDKNDVWNLNLINTRVTGNSAMIGGGIKWNYREPTQDNTSLVSGNAATLYGTDYACFAREIKEINEAEFTYYSEDTNDLSMKTDGSKSQSLKRLDFAGVMSGGSIPTTYLALVDQYEQIVTSDNAVEIEFVVDASTSGQGQFQSEVYGQTKFYSINGVYNITGLYLVADPNSKQALNLINYGIDVEIPIVQEFLFNLLGKNLTNYYVLEMGVGLRSCLPGEGLRTNGA